MYRKIWRKGGNLGSRPTGWTTLRARTWSVDHCLFTDLIRRTSLAQCPHTPAYCFNFKIITWRLIFSYRKCKSVKSKMKISLSFDNTNHACNGDQHLVRVNHSFWKFHYFAGTELYQLIAELYTRYTKSSCSVYRVSIFVYLYTRKYIKIIVH